MNNSYVCNDKITINVTKRTVPPSYRDALISSLNQVKGAYFCSSFEYPGRYTRWDMCFTNPPLEIRTQGRNFKITALNQKGLLLLDYIFSLIKEETYCTNVSKQRNEIVGDIVESKEVFPEEKRSRQPSVFSLIRSIREGFFSEEDSFLGLYGSYGYDLIFQFENIPLKRPRDSSAKDMVLFLPDEIFVIDHQKGESFVLEYQFEFGQDSTVGKSRIPATSNRQEVVPEIPEYIKGIYAKKVDYAKQYFKRGDLFEVVPSHTLHKKCETSPATIFNSLLKVNPSPYGFLINLGEEHLIGASPEMYIRVEGKRVETCPISGTIRRGKNAIEDAERIRELLNSYKDESELTMCTDVDRNDKSRICVPGSVKVIGRRQIEMYSHLIHTVDHVEGVLNEGYDSLDAFMTHMWAVTVTGAPKRAAIQWVEENEDSNRLWYGGAVGLIGFNGNINTGLTLRTIHLKGGVANVRVGATLLYDSDPEAEEEETLMKAAALMKVLSGESGTISVLEDNPAASKAPLNVLFVDHEDSFVHTLASYFRRAGCRVETLRHNIAREIIKTKNYDLVVLSPGPGTPSSFNLSATIEACMEKKIPVFGVCLGLQGIVEYFGGELGVLDYPMHGKPSTLEIQKGSVIFKGIDNINVGRYHSLHAVKVPDSLFVTAKSSDGIVMAVENKEKLVFAVQFHPESIMTLENNNGYKIIRNILEEVKRK